MRINYLKTPLNKYTFKSPTIRAWVEENVEGLVLNLFAGVTKLSCDEVRVDSNSEMPADHHLDALEFIQTMEESFGYNPQDFQTYLLDPPYAYRKSMTKYDGHVASNFNLLKNAIAEIIPVNGIVITFGYHSVSMGQKRDFYQEQLLVMYHGGAIHDTLAIKERFIPGVDAPSRLKVKRLAELESILSQTNTY